MLLPLEIALGFSISFNRWAKEVQSKTYSPASLLVLDGWDSGGI
jgi:hypothetical protein